MWVVRELARLAIRIAVAVAVALAVASLLAALSVNGFYGNARISCLLIGCVLLATAGVGRGRTSSATSTRT